MPRNYNPSPELRQRMRERMNKLWADGKLGKVGTQAGKPKIGPRTRKGPQHHYAKEYEVRSPEGIVYRFFGIRNFVRINPTLFDAADLVWLANSRQCKASRGLYSLFTKRPNKVWKGWTLVPAYRYA